MALNPEVDGIMARPVVATLTAEPGNGHQIVLTVPPAETAPAEKPLGHEVEAPRVKRAWRASVAVGAVALLAASGLGYDAYAAAAQRDGVYKVLVTTAATLGSTQDQLTAAQADARSTKVTADYVAMYLADAGRVHTDYQTLGSCNSFGSCRTSSQQLLDDLQKFQSDRSAANVPSTLSAGDASLGDALSAAIAADRELISGMDSNNVNKFKDGFKKLDAAMLNVGKAEAALGAQLK